MLVLRRKETAQGSATSAARAVGDDAKLLDERLKAALAELQSTGRSVALSELREGFELAANAGWDGLEALPMSTATYATARDFLQALPTAYPNPEVAALEDGTVAMDWFPSEGTNLTVVVFPDRKVAFASAGSEGTLKGIYRFDGDIPEAIINELRRVF